MTYNSNIQYTKKSSLLGTILKSSYIKNVKVSNLFDYLPSNEKIKTTEITQNRLLQSVSDIYSRDIHKEGQNHKSLHTCHCGNSKFVKNGKNSSHSQLYKCSHCKKTKVLSFRTFNTKLAFTKFYDEKYKDQSYMLNTKYQKIDAFTNSKYKTFFNANVQLFSKDNDIFPSEIFELAFYATCNYIDECSWRYLNKHNDDWFFLLNYNNSDVIYILENYMRSMVRKYGVLPQLQQDMSAPLICCSNCNSYSVQRYNFNNNSRRTIKCMECDKTFIIRVKNIVPVQWFNQYMRLFFNRLTNDAKIVTELLNCARKDFYSLKMLSIVEHILSKQPLITHSLRIELIKAFLTVQKFRIHMYSKGENSYLMMNKLRTVHEDIGNDTSLYVALVEEDNPSLYYWEDRVREAFDIFVEKYKLKLLI